MRTATLNTQLLHQSIEAVIRHVLVGNARNRQGIPHRVIIKRNPDLRKGLFQELGIEHRVVRDNRQIANERKNLPGHGGKRFRTLDVGIADSRETFDKRTERRINGLHQVINRFSLDTVFKANERHLDDFILFKIEASRFKVNRNK